MPQIQVLPGRPSAMQSFAGSFGEGLGRGIEKAADLSLTQKMQALEDKRLYDQALAQREQSAQLAEKQGMGKYAPFIRAGMPWQQIALLEKEGLIPEAPMPSESRRRLPAISGLSPESVESKNLLLQPQFRQAIPKDIEQEQVPSETKVQKKELRSLDDYRRKIAPNYDKLGMTAKERVDRQAEREFNAALKLKETEEKREERIEKKQAPFLKEVRAKADSAKIILNAAQNMERIRQRGNLGITSTGRALVSPQARADKAAYDTQASQFLSYYKALFPRGFTQQEFKHIEANWLPNSSNTDERNKAIEESFKEMANVMIQKAELLDSLRDEQGRLPANAEQKVDQLMGEKIKELQQKFTKDTPEGEKRSGFDTLPEASKFSGKTIVDTQTGSTFKSNGTKWIKVK